MTSSGPLPDKLLIETTTRCNLRCRMCARTVDIRPVGDMPWETFTRLLPALPGIRQVMLSGHGEPLLLPHYPDMLAAAKRAGCFVETTTNASLLDAPLAEQLVAEGLDDLVVSIDAATPETFALLRGFPLAELIANLERLRAVKERRRSTTPTLGINVIGMQLNMRELPDLVTLARHLGAQRMAIMPLTEYEPMRGQALWHTPAVATDSLRAAQARAGEFGLPLYIDGAYRALLQPPGPPPGLFSRFRRQRCPMPSLAFVQRTGTVLPCCYSGTVMGNISTQDLATLWQAPAFTRFRRRTGSWRPPAECRRCLMATAD